MKNKTSSNAARVMLEVRMDGLDELSQKVERASELIGELRALLDAMAWNGLRLSGDIVEINRKLESLEGAKK